MASNALRCCVSPPIGQALASNAFEGSIHALRIVHAESNAVTMCHEPRSLVGDAKHALKLLGADTFLAGIDHINRLQPDMEADLGTLEHRPHGYGERLAAIRALVEAGAVRLARKGVMLAYDATVRAYAATRPYFGLKVFAGFFGVLELGLIQLQHDNLLSMAQL